MRVGGCPGTPYLIYRTYEKTDPSAPNLGGPYFGWTLLFLPQGTGTFEAGDLPGNQQNRQNPGH